jgi:heptosyltransferase-2
MIQSRPERILLIRLSSIGDIVLTTPLIRILRKKYSDSRIDFLTKSKFAPLVRHHPGISDVIEFPDDGGLAALLHMRKKIRAQHYDTILDLHKNFRSFVLTAFQDVDHRARLKKYGVRRWLLVKTGLNFYHRIKPIYERYLDVAYKFYIQNDDLGTELHLPASINAQIQKQLAESFPGLKRIIAIAPGAGFATKRWPVEYYVQFVDNLLKKGYNCCVLGDVTDKPLARTIVKQNPDCVDFTGKMSLLECAAVLTFAEKLVTNDSGLMHIAEAVGTPVVAIFGSTVRELGFFPFRPQSRVVENPAIPCRPCSHTGRNRCPRGHFHCMRTIEPAMVLDEVLS